MAWVCAASPPGNPCSESEVQPSSSPSHRHVQGSSAHGASAADLTSGALVGRGQHVCKLCSVKAVTPLSPSQPSPETVLPPTSVLVFLPSLADPSLEEQFLKGTDSGEPREGR